MSKTRLEPAVDIVADWHAAADDAAVLRQKIETASPPEQVRFAETMEALQGMLAKSRELASSPSFVDGYTWTDVLDAVRAGTRLGSGPTPTAIKPAFDVVPCTPNGEPLSLEYVASGRANIGHWRVTLADNAYQCTPAQALAVAAVLAGHTNNAALSFVAMDGLPHESVATYVLENVKAHEKRRLKTQDMPPGGFNPGNPHGLLFGGGGDS